MNVPPSLTITERILEACNSTPSAPVNRLCVWGFYIVDNQQQTVNVKQQDL